MATTVTVITGNKVNGEKIFIIRQYEKVADIGVKNPLDVWESHELITDTDTLSHLNSLGAEEEEWEGCFLAPLKP